MAVVTLDRHEDEARDESAAPPVGAGSGATSLAESMLAGLLAQGLEVLGAGSAARGGVIDVAPPQRNLDPLVEWSALELPQRPQDRPGWPRQVLAELLPQSGALGDYLEHLPPGERLATLLAAIDLAEVDDFSLVEVVAAYKRMEAWSAAKAARAAATLAEREALNPTWPGSVRGRTRGECVAGEELAVRLRVSRLSAITMTACGRAFGRMFEDTGQALELGLIDYPRAHAIVTALEELPTDVAMAAQWDVLEKAPGRTLRQVQHDLAAAIIAVDPDSADARHRAARKKRRVNRPRPRPDGMASISAIMPAADAIAVDTALDAAARAAKNNGDKRTLDQLRCDSLALMGHTALALGHIGPHATSRCTCGCTPTPVPDDGDRPVPDDGGHPVPAPAPAPAPDGGDRPAPDGEGPPGGTATRTSDGVPISVPDDDGSPPCGDPPSPAPPPHNRPPYPGHRLQGCALPTIRLGMLAGGRADIRVTVPLGVLLPAPDAPVRSPLEHDPEPVAELEGYGPIPPVIARALAAGNEWRRLVTDPTGTHVQDVGRTRYQPPSAIADHVRERDRTCIRPGCSAPARTCELDHEHEWQHGGATSVENLGPLCTRDHSIKSIGAFTVAHGSDRTYAWTTPTGHGYLRRPDGTTITMPRRTAEGLRAAAQQAARNGRGIDPAVIDEVLAEIAAGTDTIGSWTPPPSAPTQRSWPGAHQGPSWAGDEDPPF